MTPRSLSLIFCCFGPLLAQNADWRFIHPDAKVFVGIKVRRLRDSQIGTMMRDEVKTSEMAAELPTFPGADLLNAVNEVLISSPGRSEGAPEDGQPPVLLKIGGDFDANRIESFFGSAGAKMQKYRHYRVFRHKGDGDMAASLVDPHTLLVGDAPSLFAALERMEWTDAPKNPLLAQAMQMQSSYDLWALFAVTPSSLSGAQLPQLAVLDSLRGMDLGVSVTDGLTFRLSLNTDSPEEASKLAGGLEGLLLMAVKQRGVTPDMAALAKSVHFGVEQNSVRLEAKLGPEQLKKALADMKRQMAEHRAQMAAVRRSSAAAQRPTVVEPQGPKVIRIEGLDDGPKEIPYK